MEQPTNWSNLFDALGRSLYYEELKGDFAHAAALADAGLAEAERHGEASGLADGLLGRGLVHILQGEPAAALRRLERVEQLVPHDADRCLLATAYSLYAYFEHLNCLPDGSGANGLELQDRWAGVGLAQRDARYQQLARTATAQAQYAARFTYGFLTVQRTGRAILESGRYVPTPIERNSLVAKLLSSADSLRESGRAGHDAALVGVAELAAADLYHRAGAHDRARQHLEAALQAYQQANDLVGAGVCYLMHGDWLAAPYSSPLTWNFAMVDSTTEGSHLSWVQEAEEASTDGQDLATARTAYDIAEGLFQQAGAQRGLAALALRRSYLAVMDGATTEATARAEQGALLFAQAGDWRGHWLAQTHVLMSRIAGGELAINDETVRRIGAWGAGDGSFSFALGLGILLNRASRHWLIRQGDAERSLACSRLAEVLFGALGAEANRAQTLVDQAGVYQAMGERTTALTLYEQALDSLAPTISARPGLTENLRQRYVMLANRVFQIYLQDMDPMGMRRCAQRIEQQIGAIGGDKLMSRASAMMGAFAKMATGQSDPATAVVNWGLVQMGRSTIELAKVLALAYEARAARNAGDSRQAEQLFAQALAAARATPEGQRDSLEAYVLGQSRQYEQAAQVYERHLARGGANAGFVGKLLAQMQAVGGKGAEADAWMQTARTHEQAFSFFVRIKTYDRARQHALALEQLAGADWWRRDTRPWLPLSDLGEMAEGLGDPLAALRYFDLAIEALEARRSQMSRDELKSALASDLGAQYLYLLAARAALGAGDAGRAFDYAQQGKARALLDLMAAAQGQARVDNADVHAWREANARLALRRGLLAQVRNEPQPDDQRIRALTDRVVEDEQLVRRLEQQLAQSNPRFHQAVTAQARTLSVEEVQAMLPADTLLLDYMFMGEDLMAWCIGRDRPLAVHHASVDARALEIQIRDFHRACQSRSSIEPADTELAALFLEPFTEQIRASRRLIIAPYGPAHLLPFHALRYDGAALGEHRLISYLPSASALQFVDLAAYSRRDWKQSRVLAIGNPANMSHHAPLAPAPQSLRSLNGAETEATYVASLFPGSVLLLGEQATEQAVRQAIPHATILHLATHGILSEEAPLASAIALANGEELTVTELMGMQVRADLVVLSACETGRGKTTGGDDVVGLTRGLLATGAQAAIVSLWPVDDIAASLFMGEFYRQLSASGSPGQALRGAQRYLASLDATTAQVELKKMHTSLAQLSTANTMPSEIDLVRHLGSTEGTVPGSSDYRHPYYWAPFILVGA